MISQTQSTDNFIGVDLSGAILHAALVSDKGNVISRREMVIARDAVTEQIAQITGELRSGGNEAVRALGVGIPGLVNSQTDRVALSFDLPSIVRDDLRDEIARAVGLKTELENDANAAAYGEYIAGAGRGSHNMFYITIGTGIGGALIFDGKLWLGASGFAGEVGHITIDPEGIECACGNIGCLETVASAPNIVRRTHDRLYRDGTSSLSRLAINRDFTAADIAREAIGGDDFALMMLERTGRYIGTAVAAVVNMLNIERIVLGGEVMEAGELILNPIIRETKRRSFPPCFDATQIVAATLGADAVTIGAALLARNATEN